MTKLTYSEIVYLFADKAVSDRSRIVNYDSHPSGEKISVKPLSHKMVTAALAYLVQKEYITLRIKDIKKLFIFPGKGVFGIKIKDAEPELSGIEKILLANFEQETEVNKAVYYLLNADESSPWGQIVTISKNSLVEKGLLEIEKERKNIFSAKRYFYVENKYAEVTPLYQEVEHQLGEFSASGDIYKMLQKAVKDGVASRQEQTSSDD